MDERTHMNIEVYPSIAVVDIYIYIHIHTYIHTYTYNQFLTPAILRRWVRMNDLH